MFICYSSNRKLIQGADTEKKEKIKAALWKGKCKDEILG